MFVCVSGVSSGRQGLIGAIPASACQASVARCSQRPGAIEFCRARDMCVVYSAAQAQEDRRHH